MEKHNVLKEFIGKSSNQVDINPRCSMYAIFTYIWAMFGVNVGKYSSTMEHLGMVIFHSKLLVRQGVPSGYLT